MSPEANMRHILLSLAVLAASFALVPARADDATPTGEEIVDQWCRLCHQRALEPRDPVMAPPFEELVQRKGRDRAYLWRFLHEDHFPMTTFRLHEDEKARVLEYLLEVQQSVQ